MSHQFTQEDYDMLYKLVIKAYHEWERLAQIGGPMMEASAGEEARKCSVLAQKLLAEVQKPYPLRIPTTSCTTCGDSGYDDSAHVRTCCHCPAGRELENALRANREQS